MNLKEQCGILYIAFGERYRHEALASISALGRYHSQWPICVITDQRGDLPAHIDVVVRDAEPKFPLRAKPRYLPESPFERTLFLDTDTTLVRPIDGLFDLLDHFDMGLHVTSHYDNHARYRYLTTANSGVVLFRCSNVVIKTFHKWLSLFDKQIYIQRNSSDCPSRINVMGDPHLMYAICETRARLIPLPASMNFVIGSPTVTASPIHIIHGRHPNPYRLARLVDEGRPAGLPGYHPRVWIPQLQSPLPDGSLRSSRIWLHAPFYALHALISRLWAFSVGRRPRK